MNPRAEQPAWPGYRPWADTVADCRREFTRVARSFWLIPEIIPPVAREDVALLYCFCRRLDDAVDDAATPADAAAALAAFQNELAGVAPPRPLVAAFLAGAARSGLPLGCADALFDGMRSDLGPVRIADEDSLIRYAYQVSSAVGLMLCPLLGIRNPAALPRAVDLGIALQLTNILLGVTEDAAHDRVYIPRTRLAATGLSPEDVLAGRGGIKLHSTLLGLAELAEVFYHSAERAAPLVPLRYRHGILLLSRVYAGLGREAARGVSRRDGPVGLSPAAKLRRLLEVFALAWTPGVLGLSHPPRHDAALHRGIAGWYGTDPAAA